MDFMFFEERGIFLHRDFQENSEQQELLDMALVRTRMGQFCKDSEDSIDQPKSKRTGFKAETKPVAASETTKVDNKLESGLQHY